MRLLLNGTYDYIRHKILYVFLDHFPEGGRQDGWIADDYLRTFLTHNGMSRVVGARSDDVFVINDADEIPAHEGLVFLKLFDGWTEPFAIHMRKVEAGVSLCVCSWSHVCHAVYTALFYLFYFKEQMQQINHILFFLLYNVGFSSLPSSSHCMDFSGSSLAL